MLEQLPFDVPPDTTTITEMAPVKSSERTLPITALAKPYFERHLDLQNEQRRLVRSSGSSYYDNDLVFSKSDGSPKRKERISSNFGQLLRRAGLPHRWRLPILGLPQRRNAANLFYEGSSNMLYFDVICYLPILWCRAPFGHHKNLFKEKFYRFSDYLGTTSQMSELLGISSISGILRFGRYPAYHGISEPHLAVKSSKTVVENRPYY
ncbi:hypothetical protein [Pseudoflavonifractor gallinarum]|uniref:hypothetical protein n=1 Tax=Pseudoflavonifractor gallinarum TaxID=2779352 RepID=UPI0036F1A9B3|nr:hypothetical protein [Oscillospiraceae bacterium]